MLYKTGINKSKNVKLVIDHYVNVGFHLLVYDLNTVECINDFLYFPDQGESVEYMNQLTIDSKLTNTKRKYPLGDALYTFVKPKF